MAMFIAYSAITSALYKSNTQKKRVYRCLQGLRSGKNRDVGWRIQTYRYEINSRDVDYISRDDYSMLTIINDHGIPEIC